MCGNVCFVKKFLGIGVKFILLLEILMNFSLVKILLRLLKLFLSIVNFVFVLLLILELKVRVILFGVIFVIICFWVRFFSKVILIKLFVLVVGFNVSLGVWNFL